MRIHIRNTTKKASIFRTFLAGYIMFTAGLFPLIGNAASDAPAKMCHNFATVSGHRDNPLHEVHDVTIVLDVIPVPQGTAYNPTLKVAAFSYVKAHLKEAGLRSADIDSVYIAGGCPKGNEAANQNERKKHLNALEKRLLPNLGWLKHVNVLHGNWYDKTGSTNAAADSEFRKKRNWCEAGNLVCGKKCAVTFDACADSHRGPKGDMASGRGVAAYEQNCENPLDQCLHSCGITNKYSHESADCSRSLK